MQLSTANHSFHSNLSKVPRIRSSTIRKRFAKLYDSITDRRQGAIENAHAILDALKNFETQNPKIPDDARAVMDVFRGQQGTILGRPLESAYHQALDHLKNTGYKNAETWLSIHVTRAYRKRMEGLLNK